jgi:ABC transport system ATP-binding/permease protein
MSPQTVELDPHLSPITVGREDSDTVFVDSPVVSRSHLRATYDVGSASWKIVDRSNNGTFTETGDQVGEVVFSSPLTLILGKGDLARQITFLPKVNMVSAASVAVAAAQATSVVPQPAPPQAQPAKLPPAPTTPPGAGSPRPVPNPATPPSMSPTSNTHAAAGNSRTVRAYSRKFALHTGPVRIGRADDNDVVINDLLASRYHATVTVRSDGHYDIADTSANGTFVGGALLKQNRTTLTAGTSVVIGRHTYQLEGMSLVEYEDVGSVNFDAVGLTVSGKNGAVYLDDVSLSLGDNSMLAVLGPSGSGKSTLTRALTGFRPASQGTVFYDGKDLYANYDELRSRIGYVPQDDILHPSLQVRKALEYAAQLRFPRDISAAEIGNRITEVLGQLGLAEHANKRIDALSGGQRKRVSVALELLTKPSMIFLDEPTSGLDPGFERSVMQELRKLADNGCTIVVVTHSIESLTMCDRVLVLAKGGKVAYFGPPSERAKYFGTDDWAEIFQRLERDNVTDWKQTFRASSAYQRYVAPAVGVARMSANTPSKLTKPKPARSSFQQTLTLIRRFISVIASDRKNLILLLAQAPVVGLMLMLIAKGALKEATGRPNGKAMLALLSLVLAITYIGASNAIREIVKEGPIYRRERAFGLSIPGYVFSKVVVLGVLTVVQSLVLVSIGLSLGDSSGESRLMSSGFLELVASVALTGLVAMAIGLLISATVTTVDKATTALPVLLLAMYLFSGGPADPHNFPVVGQLSYINSAKWGLSALATTTDLQKLNFCEADGSGRHIDSMLKKFVKPKDKYTDGGTPEGVDQNQLDDRCKALWDPNGRTLGASWLAMVLIGMISLVGTGWLLKRREQKHGLAG